MKEETFLILDSNSILHRAYHALPPLRTKEGTIVNAVYGFLLVFFKVIKEFDPSFIVACFDFPAKTFRHEKFKDYKAKRPPTPQDLIHQIFIVKEALKSFNVPSFEKEGFEADDLIGTIIKKAPSHLKKIIISGDSDLFQLLKNNVKIYFLKKGVKNTILYDEKKFREEYQIFPIQLVDFKSLVGDASDNVPGVKGIGKETALKLLKKYHSLENIYRQTKEKSFLSQEIMKKLMTNEKGALLSKEILTINSNVPLDLNLNKWYFNENEPLDFLKKLGFKTLIKRLPTLKNPYLSQGKLI